MKKINKRYSKLMEQVYSAQGRKEFISLLKKTSKLKLFIDNAKAA